MMAVLCLCSALIVAQATSGAEPPRESTTVDPSTEASMEPLADVDELATPPPRPKRPTFSRRTWREICMDPGSVDDPACRFGPQVGAEAERPAVLRPRSMAAAALLGGLVGFGTGFYYGGESLQGTIFAAVDSGLWVGLSTAVIALNQLVIRNDFRTFRSLSRGERPFGKWEGNYYGLSWVAAGLLICSHLYQLIAGPFAVRETNRSLAGVSVIPLGGDAGLELGLGW